MRSVQTFDYMKRFHCIGPDCEDTCCSGWEVNLYKDDFKKIDKVLHAKAELAPYRSLLKRAPAKDRVEDYHGALAFSPKGCGLMDKGWCMLHRDYGEAMLPTVCATYPRHFIALHAGLEVHGRLSCPEVARLCLLEEAPAGLIHDPAPNFPALYETNTWVGDGRDTYRQQLEKVTRTLLDLLSRPGFSTQEKSYFILYLLTKLESFFHKEAGREIVDRLERTLERGLQSEHLERMRHNLAQIQITDTVKTLLIGLVNARLQGPQYTRYQAIVRHILRSFGSPESKLAREGILENDDMEPMWQMFQARRALVLAAYQDRMNRYFDNFAVNYWAQILYGGHPTLQAPLRKWLLYLAITRFLWIAHPDVYAAAATGLSEQQAAPTLDRAIVEVVQSFMKTIDANRVLSNSFLEAMDKLGYTNMTRLTDLLSI